LQQYADSGPTLISIEIWPDGASAENAFRSGLVIWENDPHPPDAPVVYNPDTKQGVRWTLSYRGPHGQPHLMVTRAAMVDPYICVAALGKPLDGGDVHLFSAPTRGAFGTAGL
jgi:hypothetical protein